MTANKSRILVYTGIILVLSIFAGTVLANYYVETLYFTVPSTVYTTGSQIGLKGYLYEANYSDNGTIVSSSAPASGRTINITILNESNNASISNYTMTTDSVGSFYSNSSYYYNYTRTTSPLIEGNYIVRAQYVDGNGSTWRSDVSIKIVNQTIAELEVSPDASTYNPSDTVYVTIEAKAIINDKIKHISNVTINGSLRNSSRAVLSSFNCTTGSNGKCYMTVTAPSSYGTYGLEVENFKAFSSFRVIPFTVNAYMKDELGKSYKNIFALGEQASIEVGIIDNTTTASYNFSGYIASSTGSIAKIVNSTLLNATNSYINKFTFTVSSPDFGYGTYYVNLVVKKSGGSNITLRSSFQVEDWQITMNKKSTSSGFEYEYSSFPNVTLRLEAYPKYRSNGSMIQNITSSSFLINLTDSLDNALASPNVTWNSSCGKEGCYELSFTSPTTLGRYNLKMTLSYNGETQKTSRTISITNKVLQAQSTDSEGNIKELFGASDAVFLSISAYNKTASNLNLSNIEVFSVTFMNGTEQNYTNVSFFSRVNLTNTILEWSPNDTLLRVKMDAPKFGGVYDVVVMAENKTAVANTRFMVNPYDVCTSTKNSAGSTLSSASGQYYVSQFKTTDTVYFQLKVIQASNPLGRAGVSNFSSTTSNGTGSACSINTQTQQAVSNATISVVSVTNTQNGVTYALNTSSSVCATLDSSGGYECTVQPAVKWDGGTYSVLMRITGPDGQTQDQAYGFFEARSFYIYGWSQTWQNQLTSNITLTVQMYEAGRNWWGSYGSGGLSGTVSVEKVEYQGSDGEWVWPPVGYAYNTSAINSSTLTTGQGTITMPAQFAPGGVWKAGYYRAILKGTDSNGNTDYGYAWFGVRRWSAYGSPIECTTSGCNYKSYFNSKENISIYVQISPATDYSYSYSGGQSLGGGNITISVKKIQDCRNWPCTEINASYYNSTSIIVNQSNQWYWNANANNNRNYTITINRTTGNWGTGYYSVVLNINGTETGSGWFNTVAFYIDAVPTNNTGTMGWSHYDIRNNEPRYYNVSTVKNYKGWGAYYNTSDYLNTTVQALTLSYWDESTYQTKELTYPTHINVTSILVNGNALLNTTYNNGSWPTGYYWGQITLNNSIEGTSTAWLSFGVQPFRVQTSTTTYNTGSTSCVNATISIYEPTWAYNKLLTSNYTISEIYETVWNIGSSTRTSYTNYTNTSFANETNKQICPNNGRWGSGSWGGYHYINLVIQDTTTNLTKNGWLSFQTVPFSTSWGSPSNGSAKRTNENFNVSVSIRDPMNSSLATNGNLSRIYQWRSGGSGGGWGGREEYNFTVQANSSSGTSECNSWQVSTGCKINGTTQITIYAPSRGWAVGGNYLYAEWFDSLDSSTTLNDYYGIYIDGRENYNGVFSNYDSNNAWVSNFAQTSNLTIKLTIRDPNYNGVAVNITSVEYASPSTGCYDEWCRVYTTASWNIPGGGSEISSNGSVITIIKGSGNWTKGDYSIRASVSGSQGTATVKGGRVTVRDMTPPTLTISSPAMNATINDTNFSISLTTSETALCYLQVMNYNRFNTTYTTCTAQNNTNTGGLNETCNYTKYGFAGARHYDSWISSSYKSVTSGPNYTYWYQSGSSGFSTDSTTHTYTYNTTDPTNNSAMTTQSYTLTTWCYDSDWNYVYAYSGFKINITGP